ncbi:4Fe-4S binding protein [bacterium]|nr:4Fe-4S binding protein [candidate division CSSED10-310 bacterium]
MPRRKIIRIDESLCNGCGLCINACSEGALKLIDGKARLVRDNLCDGFGDCLGECPTGALTMEEREADDFDLRATIEHVSSTRGQEGVDRLMIAADDHGLHNRDRMPSSPQTVGTNHSGGCPGSLQTTIKPNKKPAVKIPSSGLPGKIIESDLSQWPVQLHLVQPTAPYFDHKELVVLSTCAPVASADIHWRFLRGRSVVVACPKLDRTEAYVDKLADILSNPTIPAVLIVRMTVPCCGGLTRFVDQAISQTGRNDLRRDEILVDTNGVVIG